MHWRRLQSLLHGLQSSSVPGGWPGTHCPQGMSLLSCIPGAWEHMGGSLLWEVMSC